jgi:hypothetical protein
MGIDALDKDERRAAAARWAAAQTLSRLLQIAERSDAGLAYAVAEFLASYFNGRAFPFALFDLRAVDLAIGDDMLLRLDTLRGGIGKAGGREVVTPVDNAREAELALALITVRRAKHGYQKLVASMMPPSV